MYLRIWITTKFFDYQNIFLKKWFGKTERKHNFFFFFFGGESCFKAMHFHFYLSNCIFFLAGSSVAVRKRHIFHWFVLFKCNQIIMCNIYFLIHFWWTNTFKHDIKFSLAIARNTQHQPTQFDHCKLLVLMIFCVTIHLKCIENASTII